MRGLAELLRDSKVGLKDGEFSLTGHQIMASIEENLRKLAAAGIPSGSRIGVVVRQDVRSVVALLAAGCHGSAVPLERGWAGSLPPDTVAIMSDGEELSEPLRGLERITPAVVTKPARLQGNMGNPTILLRTSGTTGEGKWVEIGGDAWLQAGHIVSDTMALEPADRGLALMPFHHGHGLSAGIFASLVAGCELIITDFQDPTSLRGALSKEITWYSASPTVHAALLKLHSACPDWFSLFTPRAIRSTSDALPETTRNRLISQFGAPVIEAYAVTEAPGSVASMSLSDRPGSRAYPSVPGVDVRIMGPDETPLEQGMTGRIVLRGPTLMRGYVDPTTGKVQPRPEWHRTGDLGYIDNQGNLNIIGRESDAIRRDGQTLVPADLEELLSTIDGVKDVMVCGMPGGPRGDTVGVGVVCDGEASEEVVPRVLDALPNHVRPASVERFDSLPRRNGKASRGQLRVMMEQRAQPEPVNPVVGSRSSAEGRADEHGERE